MDMDTIFHRLDVTRALLESAVPVPGVIAVTSADRGDGKALVATGLAHNLAGVGHRVLLVDGNDEAAGSRRATSALAPLDVLQFVVPGPEGKPSVLNLAKHALFSFSSVEFVQATFARFREHFAYTILDTSVLVGSGLAVALASESNGVVIALKKGRATASVDREFLRILRSAKVPILGVVTTHADAIRAFDAAQTSVRLVSGLRSRESSDASAAASLGVRLG